ncbi:hypothetical protein ACQUW1_21175, partial [Klebsiella pneumoniae]
NVVGFQVRVLVAEEVRYAKMVETYHISMVTRKYVYDVVNSPGFIFLQGRIAVLQMNTPKYSEVPPVLSNIMKPPPPATGEQEVSPDNIQSMLQHVELLI